MPKITNTVIDDGFIREILADIVENGCFPYESFEVKHINDIEEFIIVSKTSFQFWVERYSHIFRKLSSEEPSSAYIPKRYLYELDTETKQVKLINIIKEEPYINYYLLALEDVEKCLSDTEGVFDRDFEQIDSEEEAEEFAKKMFASFDEDYWKKFYDDDPDVPNPGACQNMYITEVKKEFILEMIMKWMRYKEYRAAQLI